MIARTDLQESAAEAAIIMEKTSAISTTNPVDYDAAPNLGDLIEDKLVNAVPTSLPNHGLWQMPSRRQISRHFSTDDDTVRSDISSTTSSKYNSDSDAIHSAGTASPATSWSSQCDETCGRETSSASQRCTGQQKEEVATSQPSSEEEESFPAPKPSLKIQTDLPWDPWFPDWEQCLSPEPWRKPQAWIASQCSQGLWMPPSQNDTNGGPKLWGQ